MLLNKKLPWIAALTLTTCAFAHNVQAAIPGAYLGGQIGWGQVHQASISESDMYALIKDAGTSVSNTDSFVVNSFSSGATEGGFAGRAYAGFQFDCHWALEFGWSKFPHLPVHATTSATDLSTGAPMAIKVLSGSINTDAFDLVVKGILPLPNHFNVYGKVGWAYLEARSNETISVNSSDEAATGNYSDIKHRYYPTFGIGAGYDFTPNFGMDLSYNRIQKIGSDQELGSTDLITLGAYFNFGYI